MINDAKAWVGHRLKLSERGLWIISITGTQLGSWSSNPLATWCQELTHWKDPDAGKDWGQEEMATTEDEMVGWHHQLNEREFEQTLGDSEGQGSQELDTAKWLNCNNKGEYKVKTKLTFLKIYFQSIHAKAITYCKKITMYSDDVRIILWSKCSRRPWMCIKKVARRLLLQELVEV